MADPDLLNERSKLLLLFLQTAGLCCPEGRTGTIRILAT
jgi:hypothetical protein